MKRNALVAKLVHQNVRARLSIWLMIRLLSMRKPVLIAEFVLMPARRRLSAWNKLESLTPMRYLRLGNPVRLAPSSRQVQDTGFSTRQQGFESPWGYLLSGQKRSFSSILAVFMSLIVYENLLFYSYCPSWWTR